VGQDQTAFGGRGGFVFLEEEIEHGGRKLQGGSIGACCVEGAKAFIYGGHDNPLKEKENEAAYLEGPFDALRVVFVGDAGNSQNLKGKECICLEQGTMPKEGAHGGKTLKADVSTESGKREGEGKPVKKKGEWKIGLKKQRG